MTPGSPSSTPPITSAKPTARPSFLFKRVGATNSAFSVNYSTTNGTALAGINYIAATGSLSFVAG